MKSCPSCGAANAEDARFCSSCGAPFEERPPVHEERKVVSVLFVDLVGSTARADNADPEDVRETLRLFHEEARRHIEQYGGVLEKFIGDAVMAVFGAPTAHGDDAERAVRAGLRVLSSMAELNRAHGLDLAARAAVSTGEAVVSLDGGHGEPLAMGDVVNTAARLQSAAPEGGLLVGAETYRASRTGIVYEPHQAIDAKGKKQAVEAWLAVAPVADGGDRVKRAPLVGRSRELDLMHSVWLRCLEERRPHLVTVLGPPGIGKSRLCHEFASLVEESGGRILRGRCLPYEEQVGYQAFARLVSASAGILGSDEPETARDKLRASVDRLTPEDEAAESFRYLALLVGLAPEDSAPLMLLLFYTARRFLECVGHEQPSVFVFEDLHWAQPSEIALLGHLGQHLRDSPVMLVASARPELLDDHATWGAGLAAATTIPLDPLTADDAAALTVQLLPQRDSSVDLTRIIETAGGNPLFLEELSASIAELGADADLPITVREAIAARIDALPADARGVLLSAAVVGQTFWRGVVGALGEVDDIDSALGLLEARDFVRRDPSSRLASDAQFTFKHMLTREVAYATVPRAVRRSQHAAVARSIEETIATPGAGLATILAHHWRGAGEPERAIPYLLSAADAARRSWAQDAVVDLYETALELAPGDAQRRRIRLDRGIALVELADYERAAQELAALVPELEGQEKLDALIALGQAYVWTERDADVLAAVESAAAIVPDLDDATAQAPVYALESQGLAMRGGEGEVDRAFELGERALREWVPETRPLSLRHHLHLHANTAYWTGRYERSLELSRETRALAADVQSAESLLRGGGHQALSLVALGRHEEAIAIWDELLEIAAEHGRSPNVLLNYSSVAYRELRLHDEALRRSEEALELSAQLAFSMPRHFAGSDLLFTHLLRGDIGTAQAQWPARWEDTDEATGWTTWLIAGRLAAARAEIALHAESSEVALEWAQKSLDFARATHRRKYEARSLTLLGQALARLGRRDQALELLRSAVTIADDLIGPPARWQARAALGDAAYELGEDDAAAVAFEEAAHLVDAFVATLAPERADAVLKAEAVADLLARAGHRTGA